jgi:beta-N-acetylhexosaminidase
MARTHRHRLVFSALLGAVIAWLWAVPPGTPASRSEPTAQQLVGQRLVIAMRGTTPSASLLGRIRRGEVGGVILFGSNIVDASQLQRLTSDLQRAARAGGQPRLLVATDQEGGDVRRLRWAGPAESASLLGTSSPERIRHEALLAGRALLGSGVNVDLAPVADVPGGGSFMAADRRTFGGSAALVQRDVVAFARGLSEAHVAATVKHFPGIGRATANTDRTAVSIGAGRESLARDLAPFQAAIAAGVPLVMISNATYPAIDAKPAPWSPRLQSLLRGELGFKGATISDALDGAAATRGRTLPSVALLASQAGVDLLLLIGSESSSAAVYRHLVAAAEDGRLSAPSLRRSYDRIQVLKSNY